MSHEYDSSYKYLFANPELVRDLIIGFVPDEWLHSFDYTTLERVNASFVTDDLKQRHDDIIWKVKVGGQWLYLVSERKLAFFKTTESECFQIRRFFVPRLCVFFRNGSNLGLNSIFNVFWTHLSYQHLKSSPNCLLFRLLFCMALVAARLVVFLVHAVLRLNVGYYERLLQEQHIV